MSYVYVVIAIPQNGNAPFIFGVFATDASAESYIARWGESDVIYRTSHETILTQIV